MTSHIAPRIALIALTAVVALTWSAATTARSVSAQDARPPPPPAPTGPQPFGSNMFSGSYAAQREDGLNPSYMILSGDRVMVNAWGAVTINDVFAVDTQGNIFLPTVGPVHLAGVANAQLTDTVRGQIRRVYRGTFGVYTNLLTASPVAVFVTGGVPRPGRYAGIPNDSVLFFLDQAGGVDAATGSYRRVRVIRQGNAVAEIDLYEFLTNGTLPTPQFEDGDTILVERRGPTVEVRRPGQDAILVELTGEFTTAAEVLAVVSGGPRSNGVTLTGMRGGQSIARTIGVSQIASTPLADGDVLTFREDLTPDNVLIRLEGEFQGPAEIAVPRGARLLDVLNHVRVDPDLAHTGAVHIRRERIRREQRRALRESLDRLERATMLALSDSSNESQIRVREAELVRQFTERARTIEPLGNMVTSTAGVELNVLLQDGDVIVIPRRTNVIRVVGEVNVPHAVQFRPDLTVHDYVTMAGGFSLRADTGTVLVMRANAEIVVGGGHTTIRPGDEIMVPPSVDDKWFQNGIDLAQVIYQIAVAASVVIRPAL